jgi:hypothetical protein
VLKFKSNIFLSRQFFLLPHQGKPNIYFVPDLGSINRNSFYDEIFTKILYFLSPIKKYYIKNGKNLTNILIRVWNDMHGISLQVRECLCVSIQLVNWITQFSCLFKLVVYPCISRPRRLKFSENRVLHEPLVYSTVWDIENIRDIFEGNFVRNVKNMVFSCLRQCRYI